MASRDVIRGTSIALNISQAESPRRHCRRVTRRALIEATDRSQNGLLDTIVFSYILPGCLYELSAPLEIHRTGRRTSFTAAIRSDSFVVRLRWIRTRRTPRNGKYASRAVPHHFVIADDELRSRCRTRYRTESHGASATYFSVFFLPRVNRWTLIVSSQTTRNRGNIFYFRVFYLL